MRTFLIALLIAGSFAGPANAATRTFGISGFERIRIDGPFKVRLATGVAPFARASGSADALDRIDADIQGRTLIVRANHSGWGGYPGQDNGPVEISLGTHDLDAASLTGSGTLTIDRVKALGFALSVQGSGLAEIGNADVDQLAINIAGTAAATIAGRAGKLTASVRGMSALDAAALSSKDASLDVLGPATIKADVTNSATIAGSGVPTIILTGSPACTAKLTGSGSVTGCRRSQ